MKIHFDENYNHKAEMIFKNEDDGKAFFQLLRKSLNINYTINEENLSSKITVTPDCIYINKDDLFDFINQYKLLNKELDLNNTFPILYLNETSYQILKINILEIEFIFNESNNLVKEKSYTDLFDIVKNFTFNYIKKSHNYIKGNL